MAVDLEAEAEDVEGRVLTEVFATYENRSIAQGKEHPGNIVESSSLAAVALPDATYPLFDALPSPVVEEGRLSKLQLEGVLFACQRHQTILPTGARAGFFIGDGAGVGKGRQIAGILFDNIARGRRKHLWISVSTDLRLDATRDLNDLGCYVNVIDGCQELDRATKALGLAKGHAEGILFSTYSSIVSAGIKGRAQSRLEQLLAWCGEQFDGCIIFDECHKAKNLVSDNDAQSAKTAVAVRDLQRRLPKARVVYCSATGVTAVNNMAFMERLGLWGRGTTFPNFSSFANAIENHGLGAAELLAMQMKASGLYVSRSLGFQDAEFEEVKVELSESQLQLYDQAAAFWTKLAKHLSTAIAHLGLENTRVWASYWSGHQRFFKQLCISMKLPTVVAAAKDALAHDMSVVLGIQTTGEASLNWNQERETLHDFVSITASIARSFLEIHFPVTSGEKPAVGYNPLSNPAGLKLACANKSNPYHQCTEYCAERYGALTAEQLKAQKAELLKEQAGDPFCVALRDELLDMASALDLPPSPLDDLIDKLGGVSAVAEMTGRSARMVRGSNGKVAVEARHDDEAGRSQLNIKERDAFQQGLKRVAIISDAASTGVSLHADRRAVNRQRRIHITVELPWSAEKAVQQMGRSHRSNQATGPVYKLISTELGGERRFAAAVAKRIRSLGALTRGDRRAASGQDLAAYDYDTAMGLRVLKAVMNGIQEGLLPYAVSPQAVVDGIPEGLLKSRAVADVASSDGHVLTALQHAARLVEHPQTVTKFLNRTLGLPVVSQIDRGVDFDSAAEMVTSDTQDGLVSGFYRSRSKFAGKHLFLVARQKVTQHELFFVVRPNTGQSPFEMDEFDLQAKYRPISPSAAKPHWERIYEGTLGACLHGPGCKKGPACSYGRRTSSVCLLTGSVVQHWTRLGRYLSSLTQLPKTERMMKVSKATFDDGGRVVGLRFPDTPIAHLRELVAPVVQQQHVPAAPKFVLDDASYATFQSNWVSAEFHKCRNQGMDNSTALKLAQGLAQQYVGQIRARHQEQQDVAMAKYRLDLAAAKTVAAEGEDIEVIEEPAPVCTRSLKRATTAPRTILSFFAKAAPDAGAAAEAADAGVAAARPPALRPPARLAAPRGRSSASKQGVKRRASKSSGSMMGFLHKAKLAGDAPGAPSTEQSVPEPPVTAGAPAAKKSRPPSTVQCPVCRTELPSTAINGHLDSCLRDG